MSTPSQTQQTSSQKAASLQNTTVMGDLKVQMDSAAELAPSEFFPDRLPGVRPFACNVPYSRNRNFEDREPTVGDLRKALLDDGKAVVQAVHGQGGVGKTQLAAEYLHREAIDGTAYDVAWWVDCGLTDDDRGSSSGEPPALASGYAALAQKLPLPDEIKNAERTQDIVDAVRDWLETHDGWLLVFDNVVEERHIRSYVPKSSSGHVIITSRSSQWSSSVTPLQVEPFEPDVARDFLLKLSGSDDASAATELAKELGYLPLALAHVGRYVKNTPRSLAQYLADFRANRKKLLNRKEDLDDYEKTVFDTFDLSIRAVKERSNPAEALMSLCAFLARRDIPLFLLQADPSVLPRPLQPIVRNRDRLDEALRILSQFGLIDIEDEAFSIHTLVHLIARERLTKAQAGRWAKAAVRLIDAALPYDADNDLSTWPVYDRLSPHAFAAIEHADQAGIADPTTDVMGKLGTWFSTKALHSEAETVKRRALGLDEREHGPKSTQVSDRLNTLAMTLKVTNRPAEAEPLYRRALAIEEQSSGPEHPEVAIHLTNLAELLRDTNRLAEAEPLMRRALAIDERSLGAEHLTVAIGLNNLATLLKDTNRLPEAEPLMRRALAIFERAFGPEHPHVAVLLTNIGRLLHETDRPTLSEPLIRRGREIFDARFGSDHPSTKKWDQFHADLLVDLEERGLKPETTWKPEDVFRQLDEVGERHSISLVPLDQPVAPHLDELLGSAGSVDDVLKALDEQYRAEGRSAVWFLPLDEPITPHLDDLLGPMGQ